MGFWGVYIAINVVWAFVDISYTANMRYPNWFRCWLAVGLRIPIIWIIMVLIKGAFLIISA